MAASPGYAAQCGEASYYCCEHNGRLTASGARFDENALTAAHRTLPLGTVVRVTANGRSVTVRITDRGPAQWTGRIIDLSKAAARKLGMIKAGVARVCMSW